MKARPDQSLPSLLHEGRWFAEPSQWALLNALPETLPVRVIAEVNSRGLSPLIRTQRRYVWRGLQFEAPPGVFVPGPTAQLIHDRIMDGTIAVAGIRYVAMGVGLGVEAVAAGLMGAAEIYALDVHPESVAAARSNFEYHMGDPGSARFRGIVSDLWSEFPHGQAVDVVSFNPPLIDAPISADPDIRRNLCEGFPIARRFFSGIQESQIRVGRIYVVLSNTAPIRGFVQLAMEHGFDVEVLHEQGWPGEPVRTYIFVLRPFGGASGH